MEEKKGYDVLRIVVHSDRCYMSTDYIKGKQLIVWLKYHSRIDKEILFGWIRELIENLEHFHQCRGNPCYQYVNPYSIIVGENDKLYLLDLGSKEQNDLLHLMQRRYVRENFLSPDNQYYQKVSVQEDIYGFGKTVQYLLSAVETEPALKKIEEFRLKNMISRCVNQKSKKCYQTIQDISEHFPIYRRREQYRMLSLRKLLVCAVALIGFIIAVTQTAGSKEKNQNIEKERIISDDLSEPGKTDSEILENCREEMRQEQKQWELERQELKETYLERERKLEYELALLYFIELEDYRKSREIVENIEASEPFGEDFAKLCAFMDGQRESFAEQDIGEILERLKAEVPNPEDDRYAYCVSKGYEKLNGEVQPEEGGEERGEVQNAEGQNIEGQNAEGQNAEGQEGEESPGDVSGNSQETTDGQQ